MIVSNSLSCRYAGKDVRQKEDVGAIGQDLCRHRNSSITLLAKRQLKYLLGRGHHSLMESGSVRCLAVAGWVM
jgi:hypothetical protein